MSALELELQEERQHLESLSNKNVELETKVRELETVSDKNVQLSEQLDTLSTENSELRNEMKKLDSVTTDYVAQIRSLKDEAEMKKIELENARHILHEKSMGMSNLKEKMVEYEEEVERLRLNLSERESDIVELEEMVRNLEGDLNIGNEAYRDSEAESVSRLDAIKREVESLRSQLRSKEDECDDLKRRYLLLTFMILT
jgi:chromosome segregation ATPase